MEKVVLAYSGGLDTSFCAVFLSKVKLLEVDPKTGKFKLSRKALLPKPEQAPRPE